MFGHDCVSGDPAAVPAADAFQFAFEYFTGGNRVEQLHPAIATERDEVQTVLMLVADRLNGHHLEFYGGGTPPPCRKKRDKGGATPNWETRLELRPQHADHVIRSDDPGQ